MTRGSTNPPARAARVVLWTATLLGCLAAALIAARRPGTAPASRLTGFALLPADTFAPGVPSGAFRDNGVRHPEHAFPSQPVQGFSSIAPAGAGWWWALADNGYGTRLNSPDFLLRIYRVRPGFREEAGKAGGVVEVAPGFLALSDPARRVPFHIVREDTEDRLLTGSDFDPEALVPLADGTFWIGDEFGPFLLHVDAKGRLMAPPVEAPGLRSPDHPLLQPPDMRRASEATVARSRGFEGLALTPDGTRLVALLEAGTADDAPGSTRLLEYDPAAARWTGRTWIYRFHEGGVSATELVSYGTGRYVLIERDNRQGRDATFKRVYAVTLPAQGGEAHSAEVLDLLDIADPGGLGGQGERFTFPFITPEALWPVDDRTLVIVNDNNYPETGGRSPDARDNTEFIRVRLGSPLPR